MKDIGVLLTIIFLAGVLIITTANNIHNLDVSDLTFSSIEFENNTGSTSQASWIIHNPTGKNIEVVLSEYTILVENASEPLAIIELPEFTIRKFSRNTYYLTQHITWNQDNIGEYITNNPHAPVKIQGMIRTSLRKIPFTIDTTFSELFSFYFQDINDTSSIPDTAMDKSESNNLTNTYPKPMPQNETVSNVSVADIIIYTRQG